MTEDEYIEYTKDVLRDTKTELPTLRLQIISLVRFMKAAGYEPVDPDVPIRFKLIEPKDKFPSGVNIVNAVHLHNYGFFYEDDGRYVVPTMIRMTRPSLVLSDAQEHKVVKEIYLQWSKRRKEWVVNRYRIKFTEEKDGTSN